MSADHHSNTPATILSGKFRWVICAVLFLGISKNYMDRQVLGVLKVTLQHDLGWNEIDYSNLVFVFQAAYAVGMLVGRALHRSCGNAPGIWTGDAVLERGLHGACLVRLAFQL